MRGMTDRFVGIHNRGILLTLLANVRAVWRLLSTIAADHATVVLLTEADGYAADAGIRPRTLCYASDLSSLIDARQPDVWVHGHVHNPVDYRIGATRVVCNPRGHIEEDSARTFDPNFTIDFPMAWGGRHAECSDCLR